MALIIQPSAVHSETNLCLTAQPPDADILPSSGAWNDASELSSALASAAFRGDSFRLTCTRVTSFSTLLFSLCLNGLGHSAAFRAKPVFERSVLFLNWLNTVAPVMGHFHLAKDAHYDPSQHSP
jgi:hypothetical protein